MQDNIVRAVAAHFGSIKNMAEALGVTYVAAYGYISNEEMPAAQAVKVERLTDGKFKAVDLAKESK
jgi:hypothetical protein